MFDGWIEIGRAAESYTLTADDCIELARNVPCRFGPSFCNKPYDLASLTAMVQERARKMANDAGQEAMEAARGMIALVQAEWWGFKKEPGFSALDHYESLMRRHESEEACRALWPMVRLFFVLDLKVDKKQAVLALDRAGFPFKTEVKGLSKAYVDRVLEADRAANEAANCEVRSSLQESLHHEPQTIHEPEAFSPAGQKISVTIDARPWAGKLPRVVHDALRNEYDPDLVALVLLEKCHGTKAEKAALVVAGDDADARRIQFDRIVDRARNRYNVAYIE